MWVTQCLGAVSGHTDATRLPEEEKETAAIIAASFSFCRKGKEFADFLSK